MFSKNIRNLACEIWNLIIPDLAQLVFFFGFWGKKDFIIQKF